MGVQGVRATTSGFATPALIVANLAANPGKQFAESFVAIHKIVAIISGQMLKKFSSSFDHLIVAFRCTRGPQHMC